MNNALIFITLSVVLTALSFIMDRKKTLAGLKKGLMMFRNIMLPFFNVLIIVSVTLYLISPSLINQYLGANSGVAGFSIAAVVGSIMLIPAFIAYPIAAALIQQGASYAVVATFMTTLIMVGILTLPLESRYFGQKVAIIRNGLNFVAAIAIGLVIGLVL